MGKQEIVLTAEGLKRLHEELEYLRSTARKEVAERIRQAKSFGDITENAEYDTAKAEQAQIEGRLEALQYILQSAVIAEPGACNGKVAVGALVRLRETASGEEHEYQIVGALETDPSAHRISNQSPLGEALMGEGAGATVSVVTPGGTRTYTILSVS